MYIHIYPFQVKYKILVCVFTASLVVSAHIQTLKLLQKGRHPLTHPIPKKLRDHLRWSLPLFLLLLSNYRISNINSSLATNTNIMACHINISQWTITQQLLLELKYTSSTYQVSFITEVQWFTTICVPQISMRFMYSMITVSRYLIQINYPDNAIMEELIEISFL